MKLKSMLTIGTLLCSTTVAIAADHVVTIKGFAFEPADLTIAAGDTVTFVNKDRAPHTATHDGKTFDTGNLRRNEKNSVTFTSVGSFDYFCKLHPKMMGQVNVE